MRYTRFAPVYDVMSGEPVYRAGRVAGIRGLRLRPGDTVIDVGCGTGLNFTRLQAAVGPTGTVVGVDLSGQMLDQARRRSRRHGWRNVDLVQADAGDLAAAAVVAGGPVDAVLFTYALSLMPDWPDAWRRATGLAGEGARVSVVDLALPVGRARLLSPLARLACALGGADIGAHPWSLVERETVDRQAWSLRGGHVQVRAGTLARRTDGEP